jgi:hypothetical protein
MVVDPFDTSGVFEVRVSGGVLTVSLTSLLVSLLFGSPGLLGEGGSCEDSLQEGTKHRDVANNMQTETFRIALKSFLIISV